MRLTSVLFLAVIHAKLAIPLLAAAAYAALGMVVDSMPSNCNPRIINVDASTGCTLTRANIIGMTPQTFVNQGYTEIGMDRIITRAKEARIAGVMENTLETLLMSRLTNIKGSLGRQNLGPNDSVILPYIYRRQRRNINSNYWTVVSGAATPGAGQNGLHPGAWNVTVQNTASPFASALVNLYQYFLPGKVVLLEYVNVATKVSYSLQFTIVASVENDLANGTPQAVITLVPNYTVNGWNALSAAAQAAFQATVGNIIVLANAVSDYESWCYQDNAENVNKLLTYWLQTSRETHEYSDEYLLALNAALTSGYFKDFRELPLAEQKRIQHAKYVRDWLNSVFYGQAINELQTVETYAQLPQVVDPINPSCVLEYKANALGAKTQLQNCGRYLDHQGNPLSMDNLCQVGYNMKRAREATGGTVDTVDFMTDRFTAGLILQMFTTFYKAKYGVETTRFYQPNQKLTFEGQVMLQYNLYELPPDMGGYNLAVFTHPYFDDKLSAFSPSQQNRARTMWGIDWSDLNIGIAATNSANRQTNIADNLYNCVIRPNVHHYQLNSTTWTTIIEDPARHYIIDGFSPACPVLTVAGCAVNA